MVGGDGTKGGGETVTVWDGECGRGTSFECGGVHKPFQGRITNLDRDHGGWTQV